MPPPLSAPVRWLLTSVLSAYKACARRFLSVRRTLSGEPPLSAAEHRVVSGAAWDEFCDTLKAAGAAMLAPGAPKDPFNQAEGYRYLSRLARAGLENYLECADVEAPQLCAIANGSRPARICIGSDNPDNLYENATLDGRWEYEVRGERGTVAYLGLGTQSGAYGAKGGLATVDYVEAEALVYDDAARTRFTLVLSATRPAEARNWLRLLPEPPEAMFIVRQTFGRRASWLKGPFARSEDGGHLIPRNIGSRAQGAPTHPGAPPQQLGGVPWPQLAASAGAHAGNVSF